MAAAELWLSPVGVTAPDRAKERAFLEWCRRNNKQVALRSCTIADVPTSGRSVIATAPIAEGDVVVEVKDDAVLLAERSCIAADLERARLTKAAQQHNDDDDGDAASSPDALLEVQALVLALMAERLRGKDSPWAAYIDFFPASARELGGMPLFWSAKQRRRLRGTAAADKTRGNVQHPADAPTRVGELWRDVALPFILEGCPLLRRMLGLDGGGGGEDEDEDDDDDEDEQRQGDGSGDGSALPTMASRVRAARRLYRWATAVVASYSFVLGDERYQGLVPAWDALNHVSGRLNVALAHDPSSGCLRMVATAAIPRGEEVVNRYGPLSTSELLRGYGFVERGNPHAHAQAPAQFALRAAVGAALAAVAGRGGGGGGSSGSSGKKQRQASGGKRGRRRQQEDEDEEEDGAAAAAADASAPPPPPEAWAVLGEELALVDSDAEVDLDLEEEDDDEDDDDQSCSDADSGGEEGADDPPASEDEDGGDNPVPASSPSLPLASLEQAQQRAPCWPLVFCAARALRLLPRGGAFRVPGVPEAEDDEAGAGGGGGGGPASVSASATEDEQRRLLARLMSSSTADEDVDDDEDEDEEELLRRAESYAAARRAARPCFPDALAAFVLLCLHAAQPSPPSPVPEKRGRAGGKKKKRRKAAEEEDDDDDNENDRPRPPAGVDAVASHLLALARLGRRGGQGDGGGKGDDDAAAAAPRPPSALRTARALSSSSSSPSGVTPEALRAACLGALAAMRTRYRGGGLERDRARAARLGELAPRRAAALLARLEEQEALEAARRELEEGGGGGGGEGAEGGLMARACAAVWVALVRRREVAREAAAAEEDDDDDEDEDEDEDEDGGGEEEHEGACGRGCHHHHHHHHGGDGGKKKQDDEKKNFAFNFDV